ncbi:MAG: hypothetical protein ACK5LY_10905 [Lachnospirales bacterium]
MAESVKDEIKEEEKATDVSTELSPKQLEREAKKRGKQELKELAKQEKIDKKNKKFEKKAQKRERKLNWKKSKARKIVNNVIFFGIIGIFIAVLFFNVFDIRDKYLRPYLVNIPVIGSLLPEPTDTSVEYNKTKEEVQLENEALLGEVESLKLEIDNLQTMLNSSEEEVDRLIEFEDTYLQFLEEKEAFDLAVANADTEAFLQFYESMYAENAERIYTELKGIEIAKEEFDDYIATFSSMEPDSVASILEEMMLTDIELVVSILSEVSNSFAGEVLAEMPPEDAATVAKLLAPSLTAPAE